MMTEVQDLFLSLQDEISILPINEFAFGTEDENHLRFKRSDQIIQEKTEALPLELKLRIRDEFHQFGPLERLLQDQEVTEILVNGPTAIWYEKKGALHHHPDFFFSDLSYRNCVERLSQQAKMHLTIESPSIDGQWKDFRVAMIGAEITQNSVHISLRRHPENPWTFEKLHQSGWCESKDIDLFHEITKQRKNFLVVGSTGSGKTSVLNSFLKCLPRNERVLAIEDTSEIALSNSVSLKLLTRQDPQNILPAIDQAQLVRRALRLRPDRLVMGEIRGDEAKDFLMALATGHSGSFGTLHASSAAQALIRLEMLIQMGAPQWSLTAIRRLIHLSLDYILITGRESSGQRKFKGLYRISSLEEHGFLTEQVQCL